ncbi:hypothetical protein Tco_0027381 [Tanacetum coccineum]
MGSITSLKCVLTQEHLDAICAKYFVPEEVHPQLPSSDATMHERPAGKVGMYTRFFDYANYRIPFSTFFVSVLTHFRIPFSQLSVFGSAKVSHFEILCRVCNIKPDVSLFRYFYTHNYKNGWFGFTKRPNVRACYSKNLDSVKNWNDHFFWVNEFVVPANARFKWFLGSNIVKDRAPTPSEYNVEHINTLIAHASSFLRFPEEFLCWVGISRNYLLNKDTYPRFKYEDGEGMDLNAFIRTADPRKVRIVERPRAENERPVVTVAKHRTVTLLPTSVAVPPESCRLGNVESSVPVTEPVEAGVPKPKRSKKKRVIYDSEGLPIAAHPPKRLRADYRTTGGSVTGEQGAPALPTLPFIASSVTASPLEEGGDRTESVTGPSLRTISPSARFVVLSDSSHHSGAKSADPEVDSLIRSAAPVMTEAITVAIVATTVAIPADVSKDKSAPHPSVFGSSSSSEKTDRTLSLFTGRSGSGFDAGSIRAEEAVGAGLEEIYVPEWRVTKAARNLSLSSEVRMRAEYNILEKRKWRTLAEEKNTLLEAKDKEIEDLKSQLLRAREESAEVTQLRAQVSGLEATENSLRGEVASAKDRNTLLEQECDSLKLKVTGLESAIVEKDHKLSELGASSSSLKSQNQSLVDQRSFPSSTSEVIAGRRWLLTHGMKLLVVKCLNSKRILMEALAYIPSAEDDFNSAIRELRDLNFPLLQDLSTKKDANTWDIIDLFCLDDTVAETLGMTDIQPDVSQLMVPVHHKQDKVIIGSQALSVALDICRGRVEKMERNLIERLPFLKGVFASIDDPLSAEALIEPPAEVPATNVLSTVVIVPHADPSVSVEDYDNPDSADVVPENATLGSESEGKIDASSGDGLTFSQLDDEARDAVL